MRTLAVVVIGVFVLVVVADNVDGFLLKKQSFKSMKLAKKASKKGYNGHHGHHHHHIPANHARHVSHASHHLTDFHHGGEVEIHEMDLAHANDFMHMIQHHEMHHTRPPMMGPMAMGIMMPNGVHGQADKAGTEDMMASMPLMAMPVTNPAMMATMMRQMMIMNIMKNMADNGQAGGMMAGANDGSMNEPIRMAPQIGSSLMSMSPLAAMASQRLATAVNMPIETRMPPAMAMRAPTNMFPMQPYRGPMNPHSRMPTGLMGNQPMAAHQPMPAFIAPSVTDTTRRLAMMGSKRVETKVKKTEDAEMDAEQSNNDLVLAKSNDNDETAGDSQTEQDVREQAATAEKTRAAGKS